MQILPANNEVYKDIFYWIRVFWAWVFGRSVFPLQLIKAMNNCVTIRANRPPACSAIPVSHLWLGSHTLVRRITYWILESSQFPLSSCLLCAFATSIQQSLPSKDYFFAAYLSIFITGRQSIFNVSTWYVLAPAAKTTKTRSWFAAHWSWPCF